MSDVTFELQFLIFSSNFCVHPVTSSRVTVSGRGFINASLGKVSNNLRCLFGDLATGQATKATVVSDTEILCASPPLIYRDVNNTLSKAVFVDVTILSGNTTFQLSGSSAR